jgi:hypothetical protein
MRKQDRQIACGFLAYRLVAANRHKRLKLAKVGVAGSNPIARSNFSQGN